MAETFDMAYCSCISSIYRLNTPLRVFVFHSSFSSELQLAGSKQIYGGVSDQFSSLGSMDSLEHSSHPYPPGRLSPSKSNNNSIEQLGSGKRDSAYSSFSTSSGTPDYTLSKSTLGITENMLYKINQWDSSGRHSNGRHSQSLSEGVRQDERLGYLQHLSSSGSHEIPKPKNNQALAFSSGRVSIGPVWHVPDMKKNMVSSTPPPTPPTRSDSFAATKVHEKGLITGTSEGPLCSSPVQASSKSIAKGRRNPWKHTKVSPSQRDGSWGSTWLWLAIQKWFLKSLRFIRCPSSVSTLYVIRQDLLPINDRRQR